MKAVVDTSVLVRALIKPQGSVGPVVPSQFLAMLVRAN
jgi:predicted nucleic acid-binding protein